MNRRQFLRLLGLTPVVAPAVALKLDDAMAGKPRMVAINDPICGEVYGYWKVMPISQLPRQFAYYSDEYKAAMEKILNER